MTTATKPLRIIDLINRGMDHFKEKGIDNARREMEWFLCEILQCKRIDLYMRFEEILLGNDLQQLRNMIKRRINGEPFQHIIGKGSFYGRDFIVNQHVLTPRPESEVLIHRLKKNGKVSSLLDIGTGTGCIAITVALENLADQIYATDISSNAIQVAQQNMTLQAVSNIQIARHDFLTQRFKSKFDLVISNPPYIGLNEMDTLQKEVREFDPQMALTDDHDGLTFFHRFAHQFGKLVNPGGYLLLEFGGNSQKDAVETIFQNAGLKTEYFKDLQGDYRVVEVRS